MSIPARTTVAATVGCLAIFAASGCSGPEQPESAEQEIDLSNIPIPPADGPPLIALRREQASQILVRPVADTLVEATGGPRPDDAATTGH